LVNDHPTAWVMMVQPIIMSSACAIGLIVMAVAEVVRVDLKSALAETVDCCELFSYAVVVTSPMS
jgi:hypothetical protein